MVKALVCPSCGGSVTIKYADKSLSCVCPSCLSVLSNENESLKIIIKAQKKMAMPLIPLGGRYHFQGHDWEVIGYLIRSDHLEQYQWSEYLLFNPFVGYRFLVCMDGHWSYVIKTKSAPKISDNAKTATYLNRKYELFHKGKVKTLYVLGEFYWRVKENDLVTAEDYIHPPEMLSVEKDNDEEIWSLGQYVDRIEIEKAFKLAGRMPWDVGVAPHQPSPHKEKNTIVLYVTCLSLLLICIQFVFLVLILKRDVLNVRYDLSTTKGTVIKTDTFTVTDRGGYIHSDLNANVSNDWFEIAAEIVNQETGEEYEYDQGIEFYSGSDYEGYWSEGSRDSDRRVAKLPAGTYYMNITTNSGQSAPMSFSLKLSEGNTSWGNFLIAIFLLLLYPIYYVIRSSTFEMSRWSQSDYSPYWREDA